MAGAAAKRVGFGLDPGMEKYVPETDAEKRAKKTMAEKVAEIKKGMGEFAPKNLDTADPELINSLHRHLEQR